MCTNKSFRALFFIYSDSETPWVSKLNSILSFISPLGAFTDTFTADIFSKRIERYCTSKELTMYYRKPYLVPELRFIINKVQCLAANLAWKTLSCILDSSSYK